MITTYIIALGSNRHHGRHGNPERVLGAALEALAGSGIDVIAASPVITSAPLGPSNRRYANAAVAIETDLAPAALLNQLKTLERAFGRRRGQRWGARVLDLDIILWSGGISASQGLAIPHPAYAKRAFVLDPLLMIAPDWRDPVNNLTIRHQSSRLKRRTPVDPPPPAP